MQAIKILVTNQKGGVGKSTIAANLAAYLATQRSGPVSLVDFDKQRSSSKWAEKAPDIGLKVYHPPIRYEQGGGLLLSETKRYLNLYTLRSEVTVCDLTWTHAMSLEFMLEFDFILIPSAVSKFEMASSEIFILQYVEKYLSQIQAQQQQILLVPSRVDRSFNPELKFLNLASIDRCSIAPPIHFIPAIDDFINEDFLFVSTHEEVANNFITFGQYVAELVDSKIKHQELLNQASTILQRKNNLTVLDKFRLARKMESVTASDTASLESNKWLPHFLSKK